MQVHEKSILLPLLPVTLLADRHPVLALWLPAVATFSMYPLLKKDGLSLAYAACLLAWAGVALLAPEAALQVPFPVGGFSNSVDSASMVVYIALLLCVVRVRRVQGRQFRLGVGVLFQVCQENLGFCLRMESALSDLKRNSRQANAIEGDATRCRAGCQHMLLMLPGVLQAAGC